MQCTAQCRLVKRVGSRIRNLQQHTAFMTWVDAVEMLVAERGEAVHEQELARMRAEIEAQKERSVATVLHRWRKQETFKSFNRWRCWPADSLAQKRMLRVILLRMRTLTVSLALEAWRSWHYTEHRLIDVGGRVIARLTNLALARVFGNWCIFLQEILRSRVVVHRLLLRWIEGAACAFERWYAYTVCVIHRKRRQLTALARIQSEI